MVERMNLVEFAEKISPIELSEMQKNFLAYYDSLRNEGIEISIVLLPLRSGKSMIRRVINEFEKLKK